MSSAYGCNSWRFSICTHFFRCPLSTHQSRVMCIVWPNIYNNDRCVNFDKIPYHQNYLDLDHLCRYDAARSQVRSPMPRWRHSQVTWRDQKGNPQPWPWSTVGVAHSEFPLQLRQISPNIPAVSQRYSRWPSNACKRQLWRWELLSTRIKFAWKFYG